MMNLTPPTDEATQRALASTLLANLSAFQSFARGRLHDEQLAADAVQESLLRALRSDRTPSPQGNVVAWFYRILRNVLTDLHRRRTAQVNALERFANDESNDITDDELHKQACACFHGLMPTLKPEYARVLQLADLDGRPTDEVAEQIGISRSNLKVRLHRARKQLRDRLERTCQACATHGCLDCHCEPGV
ncbi:MAG: RNA polymerase sigma factor [Chthoniobacterales bacterium]|nr:RNA polymerase sigma factor [Chthoniobacterales bacterium]